MFHSPQLPNAASFHEQTTLVHRHYSYDPEEDQEEDHDHDHDHDHVHTTDNCQYHHVHDEDSETTLAFLDDPHLRMKNSPCERPALPLAGVIEDGKQTTRTRLVGSDYASSVHDHDDDDDDDDHHDHDDHHHTPIASSSLGHHVPRETVLQRIEDWVVEQAILDPLVAGDIPVVHHKTLSHTTHCRMLTSMILVADFCHDLLQGRRTTTIREVYYHFVTHFRNQAECDRAIWELAHLLQVPRLALGLAASPKGWCCGCLELYAPAPPQHSNTSDGDGDGASDGAEDGAGDGASDGAGDGDGDGDGDGNGGHDDDDDDDDLDLIWNGRALDVHGMAITPYLLQATIHADDAKCILVIEKEGVYNRLSEDRFFHDYPCILVTGKGFPDIATRQWVHHLQRTLHLPVYGLCDGNPYGVSVLHTYQYDQKAGLDFGSMAHPPHSSSSKTSKTTTSAPTLDMKWLGLRPSQLEELELPPSVFQQMTDLDHKRLGSLLKETHPFGQQGDSTRRIQELEDLQDRGHKVELEALNWLGMDFLGKWVRQTLEAHDRFLATNTTNTGSEESTCSPYLI